MQIKKFNLALFVAALFLLSFTNSSLIYSQEEEINSKPAKYSTSLGKQFAAYALSAYCSDEKIQEWNCGETCDKYPGLTDITVISDGDNKGFLGYYSKKKAIVISWRGDLSLSNIEEDLDLVLFDYPFCIECQVQKGWYKAYQGLQDKFWATFENLTSKYHKYKEIWITGHSLGGALSTLNASDFVQRGITKFTWYNFGSPRVGNQNYASWLQNITKENLYRVTFHKDPVVHWPGRELGYWHLAEEVFYVEKPGADDQHILCDFSGEDPNCADQYGLDLLSIGENFQYMGYDWINLISQCIA